MGIDGNSGLRRYFLAMNESHIAIDRKCLTFSTAAYAELFIPPAVQLAFIGSDLLISAGPGWRVRDGHCSPSNITALLKPGIYALERAPHPGVFIARECAQHHYKDHFPWLTSAV